MSYEAYINNAYIWSNKTQELKQSISDVWDFTIVKPLIEIVTGEDLIMHTKLTEEQKKLKAMGIFVDVSMFTLSLVSGGESITVRTTVKALLSEFVTGTSIVGVTYYANSVDLPFGETMLLMMIVGALTGTATNKAFDFAEDGVDNLKNSDCWNDIDFILNGDGSYHLKYDPQVEYDNYIKMKSIKELIDQSTCTQDELYKYLSKHASPEAAENFIRNGCWPEGLQVPKDGSVLKADGSIDWSKAPEGGYILKDGKAVKVAFIPQANEVIDRYGKPDGRYTSPVIDGKSFPYVERSLPYIEDSSNYHQYEIIGDFSKIKEYVDNCPDEKLKAKINAAVIKYYDGDYSKLLSFKGKAAAVDGWGTGGAIQYEFSLTVEQLVQLGLLRKIK